MITEIPTGMAEMMWESFKPYLERALADAPLEVETMAQLKRQTRSGALLLLNIADGQGTRAVCAIRFVRHRDGSKVLHIAYLSGDSPEMWIEELHEYIYDLAKARGCKWLSLTGRPGWRKLITKLDDYPRTVAVHLMAEV